MNSYRHIFQALNEAGVRYLVIGGVAVNLHGYNRFTGDIDILLALEPENLHRTTLVMEKMRYTRLTDRFINEECPLYGLHITIKGPPEYHTYETSKIDIEVGGVEVPTVFNADIGRLKKTTGIDRDYLRRCKKCTPAQRLDWLAAAWEFVQSTEKSKKEKSVIGERLLAGA